ncbi:hypothetical protein TNCV_2937261 [Trichonephila clavipes]|nr:hypothetical protein TNCV_2937261 [Trichonephila clavipes]
MCNCSPTNRDPISKKAPKEFCYGALCAGYASVLMMNPDIDVRAGSSNFATPDKNGKCCPTFQTKNNKKR